MSERTEFGVPRSQCGCGDCVTNCRFMPGFLIPADLNRMVPGGVDPLVWAEANLLASPGALIMYGGRMLRVPTLVPAVKPDGSCIHLSAQGRCDIHTVAPFGCAFFSCAPEVPHMSMSGIFAVVQADACSLYRRIWEHLDRTGRRQQSAEHLRARMRAAMGLGL